jgi:FkbM family methyltransferase
MIRRLTYALLNRLRGRGLSRLPGVQPFIRSMRQRSAVIHGFPIELDAEDSLGLTLFGRYEPEETALVESVVKPGNVVVDLGACIGYYTLLFSKLVGPTGRVIAFEPAPDSCAILRRNVQNNRLTNVTIENAGVGAASHTGALQLSANRLDHHMGGPADANAVAINVVSLDEYFAPTDTIDFVKMDIQGGEPLALRGMEAVLRRSPNARILTEFWPAGIRRSGGDPDAFLDNLRALGFVFADELPGTDGSVYLYCTKSQPGVSLQ